MEKTLDYLREVFGVTIKTEYAKFYNAFPMYITEKYNIHFVKLPNDENSYVLIKPKIKIELNIIQLKKQMKQIFNYSNSTPIFVFESLRLSQRTTLIQNQIPFIQPYNQIYIPKVIINLREREIVEKEYGDEFSIAAQVTYIYLLLNDIKETNAPRLAMEIPYSKITFNRALAELVSRGLIYTEGNSTRKVYKIIDKKELWKKGKQYLFNPVEKTYYSNSSILVEDLLYSGETALSNLETNLNEPNVKYLAASSEKIKNINKNLFVNRYEINRENYTVIEQFKYDPIFLSTTKYIDIISLYAQFKDNEDERIQIALEELLEEYDD